MVSDGELGRGSLNGYGELYWLIRPDHSLRRSSDRAQPSPGLPKPIAYNSTKFNPFARPLHPISYAACSDWIVQLELDTNLSCVYSGYDYYPLSFGSAHQGLGLMARRPRPRPGSLPLVVQVWYVHKPLSRVGSVVRS